MDYQRIDSLFEKVKKVLGSSQAEKETIGAIIAKYSGYKITPEQFSFKGGIIKTNVSPLIKSEIFMRKKEILADAQALSIKVVDIR